jgi:Zn-dependent oligopeptidase
MITSIARIHRLTVVARNVADFSRFGVELLHQQRHRFAQVQSVSGGVEEQESALSNKASSLHSISCSRLFSRLSCSISLLKALIRLS